MTLNQVARTGASEIVFDRALTDRRRAPKLKGRMSVEAALASALEGSGLGFRRTAQGAFLVSAVDPVASSAQRANASDPGDGAVSELLVLGRRSLNAGIRRTRDDIQPYDIASNQALMTSGGETVEGFMRARIPANAQAAANVQAPVANLASTRSRLNLLGLGADQTLVLVDGRRLPSPPTPIDPFSAELWAGFGQADLNAIPLGAIERIEVLTSTAGAIYGPGATGGVINVILRREYQGGEVRATQGLAARGDAPTTRIDAHAGYSSADGRSGLALTLGLASSEGLRAGDRGYVLAGRVRRQQAAGPFDDPPVGRDINISNPFRTGPYATGLTLDPEYGGLSLGASVTHFSVNGFSPAQAIRNAGTLDMELSPDAFGADQSMLTKERSASLIISGRRQWGGVEGFFDVLHLESWGRATGPSGDATFLTIAGDAPENPFQESVLVSVPLPWRGAIRSHGVTRRINLGVVAQLPYRWTASLDASYSVATGRTSDDRPQQDLLGQIIGGIGDVPGYPKVSPFDERQRFLEAYAFYLFPAGLTYKIQDRLQDFNLRASGPLWRLPGGPLTMTMLAEARLERAPLGVYYGWSWLSVGFQKGNSPGLGETTGSLYGEWRAPLVSKEARGPWRGLELQLSLRADRVRTRVPVYTGILAKALGRNVFKGQDDVTAATLGLRSFLTSDLMVRASYASGFLPTTTRQLNVNAAMRSGEFLSARDQKRGGQAFGPEEGFYVLFGGSTRLNTEKARSLSLGLVYTPRRWTGARFSIDYLRTNKTREPSDEYRRDVEYFLLREDAYPDRVIRAPLTDADRARGYAAGVVTSVDTSDLSIGRSVVEAVDVSADYSRDIGASSTLRAYARATWQPSYRRQSDPSGPWFETAGRSDGPLNLRGNLGLDWLGPTTSAGINLQFYGRRRVDSSGFGSSSPADEVLVQQATHIPAQAYADLFLRRRLSNDPEAELQLVVRNVLAAKAPLNANLDLGYDPYGDPRGRRFELSVTRRF